MKTRRSTVYLEPDLHRVLKLKAVETDRSVSDLVNEAVRVSLQEDAEDLAAFADRVREPSISFEAAVRDLRKRGWL